MVNLTNSATWRQPIHELIAVGPFKVRLKLPADVHGKNVKLLVGNKHVLPIVNNGWISFDVRSVLDHEMVVIT